MGICPHPVPSEARHLCWMIMQVRLIRTIRVGLEQKSWPGSVVGSRPRWRHKGHSAKCPQRRLWNFLSAEIAPSTGHSFCDDLSVSLPRCPAHAHLWDASCLPAHGQPGRGKQGSLATSVTKEFRHWNCKNAVEHRFPALWEKMTSPECWADLRGRAPEQRAEPAWQEGSWGKSAVCNRRATEVGCLRLGGSSGPRPSSLPGLPRVQRPLLPCGGHTPPPRASAA